VTEQKRVFESALPCLHPKGNIVYSTCSIFKEENEDQVAYFCEKFGLEVEQKFQSVPKIDGMDGEFAVVFKKI
jgi:16S rRNA (cytosine967-C5)-methyltransferase